MIYTKLTVEAMKIAYAAHDGQFDRNGVPYIFHPLHVAEQMTDEYTTCVALLHDTIEDTDVTAEQLAEVFPEPVVTAVKLLTHLDDVDYFDYLAEVKKNSIALKVKLADIMHNSDTTRNVDLSLIPAGKIEKWNKKYSAALKFLNE